MRQRELTVVLWDEETDRNLPVTITWSLGQVEIRPHGYGMYAAHPDKGPPVLLDFFNDQLRVFVWADINQEDATHEIDLDGALESKFKPEIDELASH